MNSNNRTPTLTDAQEMLLAKFHDCECSFLERIVVRRLISKHAGASRYLETLTITQEAVRTAVPLEQPNLWTRIGSRLHAEEKAAVMLGKREFRNERHSSPFFGWKAATAGACILACVVVAYPSGKPSVTSAVARNSAAPQEFVPDVNLVGANVNHEPIRMLSRRMPNAVEVDWMRSDGRLRMMNEAEERAPIIWVKRRVQKNNALRGERNSSGVVMVEPRTPKGIVISSR